MLFQTTNKHLHTVEDLRELRTRIRKERPKNSTFRKIFKEYKSYLKERARDIRLLPLDERYKILIAGAYALKKDMPKYLGYGVEDLNYKDLDKFLSYDIEKIYNPQTKRFRKIKYGIKFLDGFTRKYYTNVRDHKGGALKDNLIDIFEVCNISLHLATPQTVMSTRRYFSTYTHGSKKHRLQFASNFNPLISAYLFNTYGLKSYREVALKDKVLNLHSSSEGWLGRLLASYYVARKNPDFQVNYRSIDTNIKVVESFNKLVQLLQSQEKYKLDNWKPEITLGGSEDDSSYEEGYNINCSFTSPPYLDLEIYPDTYKVVNSKGKEFYLSSLEEGVEDLRIGDVVDKVGEVIAIEKLPQCSTRYTKPRLWDYHFMRPTMRNIHKNSYANSYFIWNVNDNVKHKEMIKSSKKIAKEVGYKLVDTLKYPLIRKPASSGKVDSKGRNIRLADVKENYEPILIFHR